MTYRSMLIGVVLGLLLSLAASTQTLDERTAYWRVFDEKVLSEKVRFVNASPHRAAIWRIHLSNEIARRPHLTSEQKGLIRRALPIIATRDVEAANDLQAEIARVLPDDKDIFTTIGKWRSVGQFCHTEKLRLSSLEFEFGNCICSIGSSFNMQCQDVCAGGSGCSQTDGCGFAWMYPCNGNCTTKPEIE